VHRFGAWVSGLWCRIVFILVIRQAAGDDALQDLIDELEVPGEAAAAYVPFRDRVLSIADRAMMRR